MKRSSALPKKSINIASLKAELAKYLRLVKAGEEVVVLEHRMPIAKIIPFATDSTLESIQPKGNFAAKVAKLKIPPLKRRTGVDSLKLLLAERGQR